MKKMKTPRMAQFKALLIVPLIAGLMLAFTSQRPNIKDSSNVVSIQVTGSITDRTTGKPIPGSAVIIKGTTIGTVTLAEGGYKIIVNNSNDVLVYSHIGYRTQEIQVGSNTKINVQLEQDILTLDFSKSGDLNVKDYGKASDNIEAYYVVAEEYPTYPGGVDSLQSFLQTNMRYPADAKMKGIEGKVMVNFIINEHGDVENAKILLGLSPDIDAEALRLTNLMQGWLSAAQNGKLISTSVNMPIEFKIK